jgi:hypothetical protein
VRCCPSVLPGSQKEKRKNEKKEKEKKKEKKKTTPCVLPLFGVSYCSAVDESSFILFFCK